MNWLGVASVLGFSGVALGAFGAHALRGRVPDAMLTVWQTAVLYHLVHAVASLAVALHARATPGPAGPAPALFLAGVLLFSGSLYLMALTGVTRLGAVTPLGGLCFLGGWAALAWRAWA